MKKLQTLVTLGLVAASLTLGNESRADLPPPEGTKFVDYSFTVENLSAFPDFVVFAYPWSMSNGAPTKEHTVVENGKPAGVGRRSASPKLYAMPRAAYDTWKKSYEPKNDHEDPALDELVKRPDVVKCSGAPTPRFSLASDDKRPAIVEKLSAVKIAADVCTISTALSAKPAEPKSPENSGISDKPAPPDTPASSESATSPPGKSGCGSCTIGAPISGSRSGAIAVALFGLLLLGRRRT